ncbi:adenosylmethionine decarboxylase [Oceanotoga sp. DSM 15011]|uniref:S-adenosylmethionine decarboxylase proenzyme n=1 Tax=Oceanotoga teriensis TaxID=515440 RepID=A0AA45C4G8_9BACT|nr:MULTISPECIES: adenosylmethionine decarboxylase [Oceanotoga]MDN5341879.1 S-adenosylmethionine decarboxylase [Oceanotoga sp.]MDO7977830.1 adenosylmethionine decarboxylase [Oceanotoga teriensis]PWJ85084.1 adenosylmethionine decarboxylase proenzyme [Oceanotoga teriensis]UYP00713.1 adenosylmethionine decarboxylase [Oceanotoga sp. DSM 15011]
MVRSLGKHLIAEFYNCNNEILDNVEKVEYYMKKAAIETGATIVTSTFHRFLPHGVSGAVIVSESHLAIHTWPEFGYASIDLYTCGDDVDPWKAFEYLKKAFNSNRTEVNEHKRGLYNEIGIPENSSHKVEVE